MKTIEKLSTGHVLNTYFSIVHDLKISQYLTSQYFHSEVYGDSHLSDNWIVEETTPIISQNKQTLDKPSQVFIPSSMKEVVKFYKDGKSICISSYKIRESKKNLLTKDEEILLIEIERKIAILEFLTYMGQYINYPKGTESKESNQELFISSLKLFLDKIKQKSKNGNFICDLVNLFYPSFSIDIYAVLEYVLNEVNDKELSNMIYQQIQKEIAWSKI